MFCFPKHKAFLLGIIVASVTWIICIYLYLQLNYEREKLTELQNIARTKIHFAISNNSGEDIIIKSDTMEYQ